MYAISIPAGKLTLRPSQHGPATCELWLEEIRIGEYLSTGLAAKEVSQRHTGCEVVDTADTLPDDLNSWQWIRVRLAEPTRAPG